MYSVVKFRRKNGACPYDKYLQEIDPRFDSNRPAQPSHRPTRQQREIARLAQAFQLMGQEGIQGLPPGWVEKMNDVWQLRRGRHRVFFFADDERRCYVLLNGFRKESRRTPAQHLDLAESLRKEYFSEHLWGKR
ncbi:MAG: type II toxin-antitoxin system RelE/ParE family toxin [Chloroflexi bacterium]|nr:type II toxin-antitoxin system RelE/ParE family toxin [Chloroflexota bacterium]